MASLLAGQFSHTASIALIFMFVGLMYKGFRAVSIRYGYLAWSAVMLTHPVSGIVLIAVSPLFVFHSKRYRNNFVYALQGTWGFS